MVVIWRFHKRQQRQEASALHIREEEEGVEGMSGGKVEKGEGKAVDGTGEGEKDVAVVATLTA
jgi:hypothetical protein